jgi:hypothetical protein
MKSLHTITLWWNAGLAGKMFCCPNTSEMYYRSLNPAYRHFDLRPLHLHWIQLRSPMQLPQTTMPNPHFVLMRAILFAILETFLVLYASISQCSLHLSIQKTMSPWQICPRLQLLLSHLANRALNGGLSPTRAHSSWETGTGMAVCKSLSQSLKISLTLLEILFSIQRISDIRNGTRSLPSLCTATQVRSRKSG